MNTKVKPNNLPKQGRAVPPEISARLNLLTSLAASLRRHQEALVAAAGEDTGTPCRVAAIEVQLAVEHLETMHQDVPVRP